MGGRLSTLTGAGIAADADEAAKGPGSLRPGGVREKGDAVELDEAGWHGRSTSPWRPWCFVAAPERPGPRLRGAQRGLRHEPRASHDQEWSRS